MHNHFARWFSRNQKAVDAFLKRKTAGMNLSQRVWQYVDNLKVEMETALSISLGQGDSAATVSRKVRKYLNNPDDMFRRFRYKKGEDEDGNAVYGRKWKRKYIDKTTGKVTWKDFNPGDYHTGKGVYRSAYKNAMRMTRTEINMAYRTADQDRWGRMDFVVGYRVKRSNNHPSTDICDDLSAANGDNSSSRGVYPKSFVFKGWHPQCRCFVVPIMASRTDFVKMQQALLNGEDVPQPSGKIEEPNEYFNKWVSKNRNRIENADTLPYWVKDNKKAFEVIFSGKDDNVLGTATKTIGMESNTTNTTSILTIEKWKEKYKNCNATPKDNKRLFREMGGELAKSELRSKWNTKNIQLENAYTKSLTITKNSLDCLIYHAFTKNELETIANLMDNLSSLENAQYLFINMNRKSYKKKIKDGVQHMVSYNLEYRGKRYVFKTEVIKRESKKHKALLEIPYSLKEE